MCFCPTRRSCADYLDLLAAVEDTCVYLQSRSGLRAIRRLPTRGCESFSVTPDPGVIEVNLPPASNWDELREINTLVFEEARRNRLDRGEIPVRRQAHRDRRRQSYCDWRRHCRGQSVAAPARSAAQHGGVLAEPSVAVLSVFRYVYRPHQPISARRRSAHGFACMNWKSRSASCPQASARPGWWIACSAICWSI